jgi:hypothetical protein
MTLTFIVYPYSIIIRIAVSRPRKQEAGARRWHIVDLIVEI